MRDHGPGWSRPWTGSLGTTRLDTMISHKVALPSSLSVTNLDFFVTFASNSSRPITFEGLSKYTCDELLCSLLGSIWEKHNWDTGPEDGARWSQQPKTHFCWLQGPWTVLYGLFTSWLFGLPDSIEELTKETRYCVDIGAVAFVFDLFCSTSVRCEQFDDSSASLSKARADSHFG